MEDPGSPDWVGKEVKDIYGRRLGRAVGMIFEVGGKISSVGVEDGDLLTRVNPDRVTSDGEELVLIPEWMLESRNVGLDRGGLTKRFSALSLMVSERRISQRLSKDVFSKLSTIQKSHEAVLARTMTRLEDLARADTEIDDFVALVTLQHMAGEMSTESFDFTLAECDKIKAINGREVLDIRRTLGMAKGEQSVASHQDDGSPGSVVQDSADRGTLPEESAPEDRVLAKSYSDAWQPDAERHLRLDRNTAKARIEPGAKTFFGRSGPAVREIEDPPSRREDFSETTIRGEREPTSAQLSASAAPDSSLEEPTSSSVSGLMDEVDSGKDEQKRETFLAESDKKPILGQQVSEWVFAKIVDLEALDIRPGDYGPLRSLEKKPD
jgi:hypothetical protein